MKTGRFFNFGLPWNKNDGCEKKFYKLNTVNNSPQDNFVATDFVTNIYLSTPKEL